MPSDQCVSCGRKTTCRSRAKDGSDGFWCSGCDKRWRRTGSARPAVCANDGCDSALTAGWGGGVPPDRCVDHRRCAVCGEVGAPHRSQDKRWDGQWCAACYMRWKRHGDPTYRERLYDVPLAERFAWYVGEPNSVTGCRPWLGARDRKGYGKIQVGSSNVGAHRVALELALERPLADGKQALHRCDNPPCVNADHLYEGTPADNVADKVERGRMSRGARHSAAVKRGLRAAGR